MVDQSLIGKLEGLRDTLLDSRNPVCVLDDVLKIVRQHETDTAGKIPERGGVLPPITTDTLIGKLEVIDLALDKSIDVNDEYMDEAKSLLTKLIKEVQQREIPVIKRFSNGRCEDLRLVQEISDAIMSAILKQKPNMPGWRGEGTLDACNAVIDIMERYFQQHSTKRESVDRVVDVKLFWEAFQNIPSDFCPEHPIKPCSDVFRKAIEASLLELEGGSQ